MYKKGNSHAVSALIAYFKYSSSKPLHFMTADLFIGLLYGLALEHKY